MPFKESHNLKAALSSIGKGLTTAERKILTAPVPMPRPKWAAEHVVDPAWIKERGSDVVAKAVPEPFTHLGNEQVRQLDLLFDKKLFQPNTDHSKRDDAAVALLEAVIDLLEDVVEIADADPAVLKTAKGLEKALAPNLLAFLRKVRGLTVDALDKADDTLDRTAFIRGIWDHYIAKEGFYSESDIGPQEMLDAVVANADTIELGRILDDLRERIAP